MEMKAELRKEGKLELKIHTLQWLQLLVHVARYVLNFPLFCCGFVLV